MFFDLYSPSCQSHINQKRKKEQRLTAFLQETRESSEKECLKEEDSTEERN
jgi:hypothetical protein